MTGPTFCALSIVFIMAVLVWANLVPWDSTRADNTLLIRKQFAVNQWLLRKCSSPVPMVGVSDHCARTTKKPQFSLFKLKIEFDVRFLFATELNSRPLLQIRHKPETSSQICLCAPYVSGLQCILPYSAFSKGIRKFRWEPTCMILTGQGQPWQLSYPDLPKVSV